LTEPVTEPETNSETEPPTEPAIEEPPEEDPDEKGEPNETREPEELAGPATEPEITEPAATARTTEFPADPMERTGTVDLTEPAGTEEGHTPEDAEPTEFKNIEIPLNNAAKLSNGWLAVDIGDDWWEIFDERGTPLGLFKFHDAMETDADIEDLDIWLIELNLVPYAYLFTEETPESESPAPLPAEAVAFGEGPPRNNPQTGDSLYILFGLFILAAAGTIGHFKKKHFQR